MINSKFTLSDALAAYKQNGLEKWTQEYLAGIGNNPALADHLAKNKPLTIKLITFPLEKLRRIMGPEQNMLFAESNEKWEKRVMDLVTKINQGESFAPLIVTDFWEPYQISDGSHRHEAFLRLGIKEYWVSFFERKAD